MEKRRKDMTAMEKRHSALRRTVSCYHGEIVETHATTSEQQIDSLEQQQPVIGDQRVDSASFDSDKNHIPPSKNQIEHIRFLTIKINIAHKMTF